MKRIRQIVVWLLKPWPLHLFPAFVVLHHSAVVAFPANPEKINQFFSAAFQISGGLLILWVLNLNMGIISKSSILKSIKSYFRSFPLFQKGAFVSPSLKISAQANLSGEVNVIPKLNNIEDKVEFLFKETQRLEKKIDSLKTDTSTEIRNVEHRLKTELSNVRSEITVTNTKLEEAVVGGAKLEFLGVLNISWGVIISLFYAV